GIFTMNSSGNVTAKIVDRNLSSYEDISDIEDNNFSINFTLRSDEGIPWLYSWNVTTIEKDSDSDGILDKDDDCPLIWGNSTEDKNGCPDGDGDGWSDEVDAFPNDDGEWNDSDWDGFGDNTDECPSVWGNSSSDRVGCPDLDGDGVSDLNDPCPEDPLDMCEITWNPSYQVIEHRETHNESWWVIETNETTTIDVNFDDCDYSSIWGDVHYLHFYNLISDSNHTILINLTNVIGGHTHVWIAFRTGEKPLWNPTVVDVENSVESREAYYLFMVNESVVVDVIASLFYNVQQYETYVNITFYELAPDTNYSATVIFENHVGGSVTRTIQFTTKSEHESQWFDVDISTNVVIIVIGLIMMVIGLKLRNKRSPIIEVIPPPPMPDFDESSAEWNIEDW
ncbi:MAG: hypothetical protein ACTSRU_15055, partial [Candidatus Hodarchaeales archaeon]